MVKVSPSILSADFSKLGEEMEIVRASGADMVHIDVMDGQFVPNITFGPPVIKALRKISPMFFDVHLMVDRPERYVESFVDAGASLVNVHAEATLHLHRTLQAIRAMNVQVGVTLNPATPLQVLEYVMEDVDMVLLMSVNPGFGGQKYIPAITRKIAELRAMADRRQPGLEIQVDGGVSTENIAELVAAGATNVVSGSAFFASPDKAAFVAELKKRAQGAVK